MRKLRIRWEYVCDHCGKTAPRCRRFNRYNVFIDDLPIGWARLGREHLCKDCGEIYNRAKAAYYSEKGNLL